MAIRTSAAAIQGIIEHDDTIPLTPFIEVASSLIDELCVDSGYSDARLELIERWLSAHFYAVRDPRATPEGAGSVNVSYEAKVDLALNLTRYGQQAMLLDTAGSLASLNQSTQEGTPRRTGITWLGTSAT